MIRHLLNVEKTVLEGGGNRKKIAIVITTAVHKLSHDLSRQTEPDKKKNSLENR